MENMDVAPDLCRPAQKNDGVQVIGTFAFFDSKPVMYCVTLITIGAARSGLPFYRSTRIYQIYQSRPKSARLLASWWGKG